MTTALAKVAPSKAKRKANSMEAHFAQMTDEQVVTRYMVLVGALWAYNEIGYRSFEGFDREIGRLRREARALRYGERRREQLIQKAIHDTIAAYRGAPIIWNEYEQ